MEERPLFFLSRVVFRLLAVLLISCACVAQLTPHTGRITQEIDSTRLTTLHGNVRADLTADRDLGLVEDGLQLRLYLVLQRTPEQQAALDNLLARQQQPTAPEYHKWLTPQQYGERFGASPQDIAKISAWLEGQGMQVHGVMNNAMFIDFSATALQIREVFHTQLHYYNIRGGKHVANAQDPMIPAALENVVAGIKGLSKIPPQHQHTKVRPTSYDPATHRWHSQDNSGKAKASPTFDAGGGYYDVTPQDYYTIYNVNQVFNSGNLGAKATVAVIEESDMEYGTVDSTTGAAAGGDVATFRSLFGVPGTLNMHVYHGYGSVTCSAPGIDPNGNGEESEAALDAEWANALAPAANLIFMSCDQYPDGGIDSSMMALIDNDLSDVMSMSYGASELEFTSSNYSFYDSLYSEAAAQGQSFIVSAGDSGSDVFDQNTTGTAVSGVNVNAFGAPNVTVAGGTDFADLYDYLEVGAPQSNYWGTNSASYGNALGYIPETAWNDSCASSIVTAFELFSGAGYCATDPQYLVAGSVVGGSGGFSTNYKVPSYQSGITGYSGTMRAQPDISGFAATGLWGHALIFCDSYPNAVYPVPCTSPTAFGEGGGTSFVAPSFAGITGLLVNASGGKQGMLNPKLYSLAQAQFTAAGTQTACYSNGQTSNTGVTTGLPAAGCIFNDVTTSNNDMPCAAGSLDCYVNSGAPYGMLSLTGANSLTVAYPSTPGYDEATGIGSVNVFNLINGWTGTTVLTSTTTLSAVPTTITASQSTTLTATVLMGTTPATGGSVSFAAGSTALGSCSLSGGSCSRLVSGSALQTGANSITATFSGSGGYPASTSSIVTVTVALTATTTSPALLTPVTYGRSTTLSATVAPASATGTVTFKVGSTTLGTASLSGGTAALGPINVFAINGFRAGSNTITASYSGDANYQPSSGSASLSVSKAVLTVTANNASRPQGMLNPAFTYVMTGFVGTETQASVVTGGVAMTTTATTSSPAGTYPITYSLEGFTATNYSFTYVNGTLTVYSTSTSPPLSPTTATAGGAGFTLTVNGTNFATNSLVLWNGAARATTYVNSTQLTAAIGASDIAKEATNLITVVSFSPNPGTSVALPFVVMSSNPVATISGGSLPVTADGSGNYLLTLTGTDFVQGSTVKWNGTSLASSYVSPWQISAVVTASEYAGVPARLTVTNPAGTSAGFELQ